MVNVHVGVIARWPGTCRKCKQRFLAGTRIHLYGAAAEHDSCPRPGA